MVTVNGIALQGSTVVVITRPGCEESAQTIRALRLSGVAFIEFNLRYLPSMAHVAFALGYDCTPVVISGGQHWVGHQPDKLAELI